MLANGLVDGDKVGVQLHRLPGLDDDGRGLLSVTHLDRSALETMDLGGLQFAALPLEVDVILAASAQSGDRAVIPTSGQGRQQADFAGMALHQRLSHRRRKAEAGVGLVGAGIVQVQRRSPAHIRLDAFGNLIAAL